MASGSSEDNNDHFLHEEVDGEENGPPPSSIGGKRSKSQRSSTTLPKPRKKPVHRAPVWKHFTQKEDVPSLSNCRYCRQEIGCDTVIHGTSAMNNHIKRCKLFKMFEESGSQQVLTGDSKGVLTAIKYDKGGFRRSVNELLVLCELPFSFVESEGFRRFCSYNLPMYTVHCRKTATTDTYAMFLREKAALKELFGKEKQRVSLTTDIWVAPTTSCSYMVVTGHWIDRDWKLQKRILSFKPVTDHKGDTIASHLIACLEEWNIQKVFTVTCDNAKGNDKALGLFTDALIMRGPNALVRNGAYLHMRCCAHILNLIVRDGMAKVNDFIVAIRNAIKYVRSSGERMKSFQLRVETGNVSRGSLCLDVVTRWNSTYLMLTAALKFRVAFEKMLSEDKLYNEYFMENEEREGEDDKGPVKRVGPPNFASWDDVQRLVKFLKIFFNCTLSFSASTSVTSSICYNEIVVIERNLISLSTSSDSLLKSEAMVMRAKFEKYWDGLLNMNPLVIIASVFDPRNKMQFASLCFDKLYGKDSMESDHLRSGIKDVMKKLYEEYVNTFSIPAQGDSGEHIGDPVDASLSLDLSDDDGYERMESLYSEMVAETANEEPSSELDMYLLEKPVPRTANGLGFDYDILSWWRRNSARFPILSELARDVLAIQVSSVASESAFSTSGRILDPFRSCLSPFMVETLICTQQWLRNTIHAEKLANLVEMFEELEFHESLGNLFVYIIKFSIFHH